MEKTRSGRPGYGHWRTGYVHWQTGSKTNPVYQTVIIFDDNGGKNLHQRQRPPKKQKTKKKLNSRPFIPRLRICGDSEGNNLNAGIRCPSIMEVLMDDERQH